MIDYSDKTNRITSTSKNSDIRFVPISSEDRPLGNDEYMHKGKILFFRIFTITIKNSIIYIM